MADVHSKEVRSYNMSRIKGKNTKPEMLVRKFLHAKGFRYNLHGKYKDKKLPGKPDLVLPKYKTVIFVHGCFWHGHEGCERATIPKTRTEFWKTKIEENKKRDYKNQFKLEELSWEVICIWQCQLKTQRLDHSLDLLEYELITSNKQLQIRVKS